MFSFLGLGMVHTLDYKILTVQSSMMAAFYKTANVGRILRCDGTGSESFICILSLSVTFRVI